MQVPNLLDGDPALELFLPIIADRRKRLPKSAGVNGTLPRLNNECSHLPVDTPKSRNTSYSLETDQAEYLGLNYIGTGNADVDKKMKVFVREFMKYDTCESTDGNATLVYGAVWRATVLIDQSDASGKINFAVVAASATLKSITAQVQITHEGFIASDRPAIEEANALAMSETSSGLNVTTFVKFSGQVEKAILAAQIATPTTPLQLIAVQLRDSDRLLESVARTIALAHIARGRASAAAVAALPVKNSITEKAVLETYRELSVERQDPSDKRVQLAAQQLIHGVKVPLSLWD